MKELRTVQGFEDLWRTPVRTLYTQEDWTDRGGSANLPLRTRLRLLVDGAPEVVTTLTGRSMNAKQLKSHLNYISRNGDLPLEDQHGCRVQGAAELKELAEDWAHEAQAAPRQRADAPLSRHLVLSMPNGADPQLVHDAARGFATRIWGDQHDYVFALHTDTPCPHVHMVVAALGREGRRLLVWTPDMNVWRSIFAEELRARGCDAQATPRRTRGMLDRSEPSALRYLRKKFERGERPAPEVDKRYLAAAAKALTGSQDTQSGLNAALEREKAQWRSLFLQQAVLMMESSDHEDRALARKLVKLVGNTANRGSRHEELVESLRLKLGLDAPLIAGPHHRDR